MPGAAIEIENLTKDYPFGFLHLKKKRSLEGLTMQVEDGEVFGFLGPNGAGKSTTIKLLVGLIFPDAGSAQILGRPITDIEMHRDIGYLPEQPYFYDHLSARELLNYYGQLSGMPARSRSARVEEMLKRVGLSDSAGVELRKFSKGMLQRVGLAQAVLHDPKLVFLDEPMSGLDPMGRREVRDLIHQLRSEGKTVFFSTHILSDAEALCDRVGVIQSGQLRGVGAVAELTSQSQGKIEIIFHAQKVPAGLTALGAEARVSGEMVNAVLSEAQQDAALDLLRRERIRLISLAPVRRSLEEYYLQKLQPAENRKGAVV